MKIGNSRLLDLINVLRSQEENPILLLEKLNKVYRIM